jgi:hypothetical protein
LHVKDRAETSDRLAEFSKIMTITSTGSERIGDMLEPESDLLESAILSPHALSKERRLSACSFHYELP